MNQGKKKKTIVVNKYKEHYDVYIGRGSAFGNESEVGKDGTREEVIELYKIWFYKKLKHERFKRAVLKLVGKRLGCFCKPKKCHGTIILKYLRDELGGKLIDDFTLQH